MLCKHYIRSDYSRLEQILLTINWEITLLQGNKKHKLKKNEKKTYSGYDTVITNELSPLKDNCCTGEHLSV